MKALERSYFYAKEASLQYALMDGLSKTNFGPSYILMNFLFMNCTRSEPMRYVSTLTPDVYHQRSLILHYYVQ